MKGENLMKSLGKYLCLLVVLCLLLPTTVEAAAIENDSVAMNEAQEDSQTSCAITAEPEDVSVENGGKAKFTVQATGDGLTYQWYFKDVTASRFSRSTTGNSATYTVAMKESRDGRQVYCVITDQYGNTVQSRTATMRIRNTAKIVAEPGDVTVAPGKVARVTVEATGDGLTYAWYYKNPSAKSFTKSASYTGDSISITMKEARDGRQVYCVITDQYGNSVTTSTATMTMEHYAEIVTQPKDASAVAGKSAKVTVKATGDGLTYAWYYKNPGSTKFTKSSVKGSSYSLLMSAERSGRQLYCVITDQYGNTVKTDTVTLTLKTVAKIITQPYPVHVGTKTEIGVEAEGDGLTYQWYYKDVGKTKFSKLTYEKSDTYSVAITNARNGRKVYCKITDQYGNSVKTDTVTMMTMDYFNALSQTQKKALAKKVAQYIADFIGTEGSDLDRVYIASQIVYAYCQDCYYTTEGKDYREAHGVFIKGEFSCAGSTRALGMVLDCMGIKWTHVNPNQWTHQWCSVKIDGKTGWADGMIGMAGYGEYPYY